MELKTTNDLTAREMAFDYTMLCIRNRNIYLSPCYEIRISDKRIHFAKKTGDDAAHIVIDNIAFKGHVSYDLEKEEISGLLKDQPVVVVGGARDGNEYTCAFNLSINLINKSAEVRWAIDDKIETDTLTILPNPLLAERFIAATPELDPRIVSFLQAHPEYIDTYDGGDMCATPSKWQMISDTLQLVEDKQEEGLFTCGIILGKVADEFIEYLRSL